MPPPNRTAWHIAADTGGTFTDCHTTAPDGTVRRVKVLSSGCLRATILREIKPGTLLLSERWPTPPGFFRGYELRALGVGASAASNITDSCETDEGTLVKCAAAVTGGLIELSANEAAPVLGARLLTGTALGADFPPVQFRLATTRATNALLERKGSRVAFFVTRGFGDLLLIGDQRRADLFALRLAPREQHHEVSCEVDERLDACGEVLVPLDEAKLRSDALRLVQSGITTAAVALLHSDVNPAHERRVRDILLAAGFGHVSLSRELAPFTRILPRAQSAVANAYLTEPVDQFIHSVRHPFRSPNSEFRNLELMTSTGSLEPAEAIKPKDLLLSGPAAGALGALNAARRFGFERIITFDMGGTSTDVARIDGALPFRFTQRVGSLTLLTPAVAIETVAAGGGSICAWTPSGLAVGPESAGADPGPACYGRGGPLTVTDVNLLLGRFDPARAPIPLDVAAAESRADELLQAVNAGIGRRMTRDDLLRGLLALAVEHMADAIRKISVLEGCDPADYALLAFGGAGPQHACDVAEHLGMKMIIVPADAGILSAVGLQEASHERMAETQILRLLNDVKAELPDRLGVLVNEATTHLEAGGSPGIRCIAELRLLGQETPLQIEFDDLATLDSQFSARFTQLFGYAPPSAKPIELVTLRVIASTGPESPITHTLPAAKPQQSIDGHALVQDAFSTLIISEGWNAKQHNALGWTLSRQAEIRNPKSAITTDLLRHRFTSIVEDMGALLRRTALSTNIRERLDFSCALLTPEGKLISSAPHIPVHLGALGECVREVIKKFPARDGDTIVTNHPAFGGSHLPDVTLITPVFDDGRLLGYIANRAHHAEIGGLSPGSMPANATALVEEGVVIAPMLLCRDDLPDFETIRHKLTTAPFPTRAVEDNIADLHAQLAANRLGAERLRELFRGSSSAEVMESILEESRRAMRAFIDELPEGNAVESLDDGSVIKVHITKAPRSTPHAPCLSIEFTGTSSQHPGNLNATPAIVRSAVLYVLRLALQQDLPLNEGLLNDVKIILPFGSFLNPIFNEDPARCPAVVGGNVEVSQRVVDTLIKALRLQACSQGTMNNFLFGNEQFGCYETICGGTGAGEGYRGASAQHSHMTNTAITDAEVIERRYPVRLREFSIRRGSGGKGKWQGGDGVVREFEFLKPLTVSLLTQHRNAGPFGMGDGEPGAAGIQVHIEAGGKTTTLPSSATFEARPGDRVRIETPGGGAWGAA